MPKYVQNLIGVLVLLVFVVYFSLNVDKFRPLLDINVGYLLLIGLANMLAISANGIFIKFILQPFQKYISVLESVYVSLISTVGNFFAPVGGGLGIRAVYLKKRHDLSYTDYLTTLSGNYIIVFLVNSFFGLLALFLLREHAGPNYYALVVIFSGLFVATLLLSFIKLPSLKVFKDRSSNRFVSRLLGLLFQISTGWQRIISNRKLTLRLIGITVFNFLMSVLITALIMAALSYSITFAQLLLFSVLGFLSLFVNITPANLGVKEAIYIFSASVLGFSVEQIILIALVDRGVVFIVLVLLWLTAARRSQYLPQKG